MSFLLYIASEFSLIDFDVLIFTDVCCFSFLILFSSS